MKTAQSQPPTSFLTTLINSQSKLKTPLAIAGTIFVGGIAVTYFTLYKYQKQYKSTQLYQDGLKHLALYEPAVRYVGDKWRVGWVKEATVTDDAVNLVVPFQGAVGKAHLHIHGVKGVDNQPKLDSLDLEVFKPNKKWTFYRAEDSKSKVLPAADGEKKA